MAYFCSVRFSLITFAKIACSGLPRNPQKLVFFGGAQTIICKRKRLGSSGLGATARSGGRQCGR